jgi:hypothetical protein
MVRINGDGMETSQLPNAKHCAHSEAGFRRGEAENVNCRQGTDRLSARLAGHRSARLERGSQSFGLKHDQAGFSAV